MPDHEQDHVKKMIIEEYSEGQLIDEFQDNGIANCGWWKINNCNP